MTGPEFRALEQRAGLSLARTAALCGVTRNAVSKWRAGDRPVPTYAVRLVAAELEQQQQRERGPR